MTQEGFPELEPPPYPAELPPVDEYGLPRPTVWPAVLASGVTLLGWGFFSSPALLIAGLILLSVSMIGWVRELRQQARAELEMRPAAPAPDAPAAPPLSLPPASVAPRPARRPQSSQPDGGRRPRRR